MMVLNLITLALLGTSIIFSIIELGLSAYVVSVGVGQVYEYWDANALGDGYGGYLFGNETVSAPHEIDFLLFCSLWTLLVSSAFVVLPVVWAQRPRPAGTSIHSIFGPLTFALNAITMVFWLAGFAALAHLYNGDNPQNIAGALLAFAIMLWLIFLALLILNILTASGVLKSERLGHHAMFTKNRNDNFAMNPSPVNQANTVYPVAHQLPESRGVFEKA